MCELSQPYGALFDCDDFSQGQGEIISLVPNERDELPAK